MHYIQYIQSTSNKLSKTTNKDPQFSIFLMVNSIVIVVVSTTINTEGPTPHVKTLLSTYI